MRKVTTYMTRFENLALRDLVSRKERTLIEDEKASEALNKTDGHLFIPSISLADLRFLLQTVLLDCLDVMDQPGCCCRVR